MDFSFENVRNHLPNTLKRSGSPSQLFQGIQRPAPDKLLQVDHVTADSIDAYAGHGRNALNSTLGSLGIGDHATATRQLKVANDFLRNMKHTPENSGVFSGKIKGLFLKKQTPISPEEQAKQKEFNTYRKSMIAQSEHDFSTVESLNANKQKAIKTIANTIHTGRAADLEHAFTSLAEMQGKFKFHSPEQTQHFNDVRHEIGLAQNISGAKADLKKTASQIENGEHGNFAELFRLKQHIGNLQQSSQIDRLGPFAKPDSSLENRLEEKTIKPAFDKYKEATAKQLVGLDSPAAFALADEKLSRLEYVVSQGSMKKYAGDVQKLRSDVDAKYAAFRQGAQPQNNRAPSPERTPSATPAPSRGRPPSPARSVTPTPNRAANITPTPAQHGNFQGRRLDFSQPREQLSAPMARRAAQYSAPPVLPTLEHPRPQYLNGPSVSRDPRNATVEDHVSSYHGSPQLPSRQASQSSVSTNTAARNMPLPPSRPESIASGSSYQYVSHSDAHSPINRYESPPLLSPFNFPTSPGVRRSSMSQQPQITTPINRHASQRTVVGNAEAGPSQPPFSRYVTAQESVPTLNNNRTQSGERIRPLPNIPKSGQSTPGQSSQSGWIPQQSYGPRQEHTEV